MSEICHDLHQFVNGLDVHTYPFDNDYIPMNGIYFFLEEGEYAHGGRRIVRVGTHLGRHQLRSRLRQHFAKKLSFQKDFRVNILNALLNRHEAEGGSASDLIGDLPSWDQSVALRHIRSNFSFVTIRVDDKQRRRELEGRLIGTIARCKACGPSESWLGHHSPKSSIRRSGLWQTQKLGKPSLSVEGLSDLMSSCVEPPLPEFEDPLLRLVSHHLYAVDGRNRQPAAYVGKRLAGRRNTFLQSFYKAYQGEPMAHEKLASYTWSNLGWRLGVILRSASDGTLSETDQQRYGDLLFSMLAHLYKRYLEME